MKRQNVKTPQPRGAGEREHRSTCDARLEAGLSLAGCVVSVVAAGGAMFLLAGCASDGVGNDRRFEPVTFRAESGELEAVVRGDFFEFEPGRDRAPKPNLLDRIIFGERRSATRRLRTPQGMTFDGSTLLVCDQGGPGVATITRGDSAVRWMSGLGRESVAPLDVCADGSGRVFIVDQVAGVMCSAALKEGLAGGWEILLASDESHRPVSAAVSPKVLAVGDARAGRIERFDVATRRRLEAIEYGAGGARIVSPTGLAFAPDGSLLAADAVQGVVHRFDAEGVPLEPLGRSGRGEGEFVRPKDVCVTRSGRVVVADAGRQSVLVFDSRGRFLIEVRGSDGWPGFTMPGGVCTYDLEAGEDAETGVPDGRSGQSREFVVVADTLGAPSLVLVELREMLSGGEGR
ncbi:MAG: hypothetical protein FLDDKLPJ_02221 [Phycisphaerae bacterium]|nr:hypothetical protein [Phycisphaerae bacterium]